MEKRRLVGAVKMKVIKLLIFLYFLAFPLGQLTRLPLSALGGQLIKTPEIRVYLTDLVIAGLVGGWLGWKLVRRGKFISPSLTGPIFLFSGFAFLSLIFNTPLLSGREVAVAGLYLVRWVVYAGVYFVIYDLIHNPRVKISNLKTYISNLLIGAGVVSAIFGLLQYFFLPDTRFLYYSGWDDHYYRLIGTFLDPGFTGMIYVLTLILLISFYWKEFSKKKSLLTPHFLLLVLVYLAFVLTYARSAYLAYLVGMGVIAFKKKAPKFFVVAFLVWLVTILLLPRPSSEGVQLERKASIFARVSNWQQTIKIAKDHPLFGVGFNAYRYVQRDYGFLGEDWQVSHAGAGADSSLLFVLATTGIFGFTAYLWLWWKIIQRKSLIILASAAALLTHSLFLNSLFYPWLMAWIWVLLGVFQEERFRKNN